MVRATPVGMFFFLVVHTCSILLALIWVARRAASDTDGAILLLHQQLRILQRKQPRPPLFWLLVPSSDAKIIRLGYV